jgi:hypothetical protein
VIPPKVPVERPADTDRFAGFAVFAEIVMVFPTWDNVMLLPPASTSVPEETSARVPVVFPAAVTLMAFWVWTVWV